MIKRFVLVSLATLAILAPASVSANEYKIDKLERELLTRELNIEQHPDLIVPISLPKASTFKARPKRSIIVAVVMTATMLFSIFTVLIFDRSKDRLPI